MFGIGPIFRYIIITRKREKCKRKFSEIEEKCKNLRLIRRFFEKKCGWRNQELPIFFSIVRQEAVRSRSILPQSVRCFSVIRIVFHRIDRGDKHTADRAALIVQRFCRLSVDYIGFYKHFEPVFRLVAFF